MIKHEFIQIPYLVYLYSFSMGMIISLILFASYVILNRYFLYVYGSTDAREIRKEGREERKVVEENSVSGIQKKSIIYSKIFYL